MKHQRWIGPCMAAVGLIAVAGAGYRAATIQAGKPQASVPAMKGPLGVDTLMLHVDQYAGSVQVQGVVSAVMAEQQTLALIDIREVEKCGVTTCAELILPVRWTGAMPAVKDVVLIEGQVRNQNGKLVFDAQYVKPLNFEAKGANEEDE